MTNHPHLLGMIWSAIRADEYFYTACGCLILFAIYRGCVLMLGAGLCASDVQKAHEGGEW